MTELPCLDEALDCLRDVGLLPFITDKEHWNEELLLQFNATLHISGYNGDPKSWKLNWMTGDVHHEADAQELLELTKLPKPGEFYNEGTEAYAREVESIFKKPEPNVTQMLTMMIQCLDQHENDVPKAFYIKDLQYLPRTMLLLELALVFPLKRKG